MSRVRRSGRNLQPARHARPPLGPCRHPRHNAPMNRNAACADAHPEAGATCRSAAATGHGIRSNRMQPSEGSCGDTHESRLRSPRRGRTAPRRRRHGSRAALEVRPGRSVSPGDDRHRGRRDHRLGAGLPDPRPSSPGWGDSREPEFSADRRASYPLVAEEARSQPGIPPRSRGAGIAAHLARGGQASADR
jgi:hypothetical protein